MRKTLSGLWRLLLLGLLTATGCAASSESPTLTSEVEHCSDKRTGARLSYPDALQIARSSECVEQGYLSEIRLCNEDTGTWWIDLEIDKPGCSPTCVIDVSEKTAEINWRCTGLVPETTREPDPTATPMLTPTTPVEAPSTVTVTATAAVTVTRRPVEPPDPVRALEAVLEDLIQRYGDQAPQLGLTWTEEPTSSEDIEEVLSIQYTSGDWVASVSFPARGAAIKYEIMVDNQAEGFHWIGQVDASWQVKDAPVVPIAQPVACWYGSVRSLPPKAQFEDYLALEPQGSGAVGITGAEDSISARIQALRDQVAYVHFWGTFTCNVLDYGGCQLVATHLREEGPGPLFDPEPVDGWAGTVRKNPPSSQHEDYFTLEGDFPIRYGIGSSDERIAAEIERLGDSQAIVRVWGRVICGVLDSYGSHIQITKLEVLEEPLAPPQLTSDLIDGWVGTIVRFPRGFQLDDYFQRDDGQRFGISPITPTIQDEMIEHRWTGAQVRLRGRLFAGVPDLQTRQIRVEHIEAVSAPADQPRNLSAHAFPSASSTLRSDRWGTYDAGSTINGSLSSPWAEGVSGSGIGEWVMFSFPEAIHVHRIGLAVGHDRDDETFLARNRVKKVTLNFSRGEQMQLTFSDTRGMQMKDIGPVQSTYVQVVIDEVYPGEEYDDTCLGEVEVWGVTLPARKSPSTTRTPTPVPTEVVGF